jgi:hypothetical protein
MDLFAQEKSQLLVLPEATYSKLFTASHPPQDFVSITKLHSFDHQPQQHDLMIYQQLLNQQTGEHYEFNA